MTICSCRCSAAIRRATRWARSPRSRRSPGSPARAGRKRLTRTLSARRSPGRLEILRRSPTVIIDAAHNPNGMAATVAAIEESFTFTRLTGVFAASGDKDVAGILAELEPLLSEVVVTRNSSDRSMDAEELAELAAEIFGEDRVSTAERLDDAIEMAV